MAIKNLVLYHYFEKDSTYRDNFLHFLAFGIEVGTDYVFIISSRHALDLPHTDNVRYVFTDAKRSDFGGYASVINDGLDLTPYNYIFFINSSVRGPFLPPYLKNSWTDFLLGQFQPDVGMVGISICTLKESFRHSISYQECFGGIPPYSHVQTMVYVLPRSVLEEIIAKGFYREERDISKSLAIENYEIHLSQLILQQGKNLRCLLPEFNAIDYRLPYLNPNPTSTIGDPNEVLGYFGRSVHPYEILFVKSNRDLYSEGYLARLTYSMHVALLNASRVMGSNSISIQDYLARSKELALLKEHVIDFSYLPGALQDKKALKDALEQVLEAKLRLSMMLNSTSWKITKPLRRLKDWLSN